MGHKKTFWKKDKEKGVGGMEVVKQDMKWCQVESRVRVEC